MNSDQTTINQELNSLNLSDITVLIRSDDVLQLIDKFINDNKLSPNSAQGIFNLIYSAHCTQIRNIPATSLLFNKRVVDDILESVKARNISNSNKQ